MLYVKKLSEGKSWSHGDEVYAWEIETDMTERELLSYCRTVLKSAERSYDEYLRDYNETRDNSSELLKIVEGGHYRLESIAPAIYHYIVTFEYVYID